MAPRQPNDRLRLLLEQTGWTHEQFARRINRLGTETGRKLRYDGSSVCHWLNGVMPRSPVRRLILEVLSRRLNHPVTHAEAGFPPLPAHSTPRSHARTVEELAEFWRQDMDPSRRGVLGAAFFSVALAVPEWPEVVSRTTALRQGAGQRIGMGEVATVTTMTRRISELDDEFGTYHARPMAVSFLANTVSLYLAAEATTQVREALLSATSGLCRLTGYMAVDETLHGLGQRYYGKALELAGAARDRLAYCGTLRMMSVQAVDLGHGPVARRLADAAAEAAPGADPRRRAFLSGQQAHAAAQTGDRSAALRHLGEAERALDRAGNGDEAFAAYDPAALMYHVSQVRHHLGDRGGSAAAMQATERLRHVGYQRTTVRRRFMLAERQLAAGLLEEACATWNHALDDYPHVRSGRCDERFSTMRSLLRPHLRNRHARQLHDRARSMAVHRTGPRPREL
ncbi:tetratricopeptide repeat protein [Streptomyces sp. YIM 98790]|uniref:tetratricopeptide repeat protein n=1 Tax=Streptomyces sp. YIM 98790 TaxID=2689077 RepID=UPI0014084C48|nr:tetratricopeptide repeat protein [Streptomyces sp. YIM 98790]